MSQGARCAETNMYVHLRFPAQKKMPHDDMASRTSATWQCVETRIAVLDIEKTFDFMQHSAITSLLIKRGWGVGSVFTRMKHMQHMQAKPDLEGMPPMLPLLWEDDRGVRRPLSSSQT